MTRTIADIHTNTRDALLGLVPLAIAELRGATFEQRQARVAGAADLIASQADEMMFGKNRRPTGVLAALAMGLAALAWQPGGVTALGLHVCARPHPHCPARGAQRAACCVCETTCTAAHPDGTCPDGECGWCGNGCECCTCPAPVGRIVLLKQEAS